jgi:Spy/CpxP family protein refolding chaperone
MTVKKTLIALALVSTLAIGGIAATQTATGHAMWAGHRAKRMAFIASYLDMTDAQKTQAKTILQDSRTASQPLFAQLRQGHQAMIAAIKANKPEADLKAIADSQAPLVSQLAVQKALTGEKLWALLTPDQQAKAEKLHSSFMKSFEGHQPAAQ